MFELKSRQKWVHELNFSDFLLQPPVPAPAPVPAPVVGYLRPVAPAPVMCGSGRSLTFGEANKAKQIPSSNFNLEAKNPKKILACEQFFTV